MSKAKIKNFTFKKEDGGVWHGDTADIKLGGRVCGMITPRSRFTDYQVRFMVTKADILEDGNKNCPWKWVGLTGRYKDLKTAEIWVRENSAMLQEKYPNLRFED